jgi:hypothetical protein
VLYGKPTAERTAKKKIGTRFYFVSDEHEELLDEIDFERKKSVRSRAVRRRNDGDTLLQTVLEAVKRNPGITATELATVTGLTRRQVRVAIYARNSKDRFRSELDVKKHAHYYLADAV